MDGIPPERREDAPSMEPARETAKERGGGTTSVRNVLSSSGAGGVTLWGGDLGFVGRNFQEYGGGARGFNQTGDGSEGQAVEGRDLENCSSGEGTQVIWNSDTGDVH